MIKTLVNSLATGFVCSSLANAAVTVAQSGIFQDGNSGGSAANSYTFSISGVAPNNLLVVGIYIDAGNSAIDSATFGGLEPTSSLVDGRLTSFIFSGLSSAVGGDLFIDQAQNPAGIGVVWYEVNNADTISITSVTALNTISTSAADDLVIGLAGRNGTGTPSPTSSSIFSSGDPTLTASQITGGGAISSDSAIASSIGSLNFVWNNATEGRIAYSFQAIPEPSLAFVAGVFSLLMVGHRQRG